MNEDDKRERLARRRALERERWAQEAAERSARWKAEGTRLTWEELADGVPCRGCGLPWGRDEPELPAPLYRNPEEQAEGERRDREFRERHPDCGGGRHGMSGGPDHCRECCPPPPISPTAAREVAELWKRLTSYPTPPHELLRWTARLTCGHEVEVTQNRDRDYLTSSTQPCSECGIVRGVVRGTLIGPVAEPPKKRPAPDPSGQAIAEAEAEVARAKKRLKELRERRGKGPGAS